MFIADDHAVVRKGLRALLETEPDLIVIGEAEDGLATISEVERLKPDVLIVDMMMPGLDGMEVTRQVHQRLPATHIVVLSLHDNEPYVLHSLRNGASAYIIKSASTESIVQALREVQAGRRYLSPPLTERAISAYMLKVDESERNQGTYEMLTGRERQVLHLAAEGLGNTEIGDRLCISPRTAETHRTNLMRKLRLHNHSELIRYAFQQGIVGPD